MNPTDMFKALVDVAALFVLQMTQKVHEVNAPKNIIGATSIQPPVIAPGGASIDVTISLDEDTGAPAAGAFEWGSGIHATKGNKGKYKIEPKRAQALAIPYESWSPEFPDKLYGSPKFIGFGEKGYIFKFVEHPGVEARPYIVPTLQEHSDEYRAILAEEFKAMVLSKKQKLTIIEG